MTDETKKHGTDDVVDISLAADAAADAAVEAEAREVLTRALAPYPVTIVDLLATDEGAEIDFAPERLGLTARAADL